MKKTNFRNIFIGLIFIGIAVFIVLDVMEITAGIELWRILLTLFATVVIVKSIRPLNFVGIFFPLALVGILFGLELGIEAFTPWPILLIALFLSIGCGVLFKRKVNFEGWGHRHGRRCNPNYEGNSSEEFTGTHTEEGSSKRYTEEKFDNDRVWKMEMGLGKKITYVTSQNLREASIECGLGELQIYFTEAKMEGDSIRVNAEVGMGHAVLYFPTGWNVVTVTSEVCGRVNEQKHTVEEGAPKVYLNLGIGFGEVEILYI
jgi:hypothetical protein